MAAIKPTSSSDVDFLFSDIGFFVRIRFYFFILLTFTDSRKGMYVSPQNSSSQSTLTVIDLPGVPVFKTGKVRSVFDLGDTLLLVASDRISAFDHILPDGIPGKGRVLTQMSAFWFDYFKDSVPHHLLSVSIDDFPPSLAPFREILDGRTMWVKKTQLIDIECVARGYLIGSGWQEYKTSGTVCGIPLPAGLRLADRLPEPIFTPAYKAPQGQHDENISFERTVELVGQDTANTLRKLTLDLYTRAADLAATKGLILADTKFEFGRVGSDILLIDEALTPDSSRYWEATLYSPGSSPPSFDKQIVRDYLESSGWDKESAPPQLPPDIISSTSQRYQDVFDRIRS